METAARWMSSSVWLSVSFRAFIDSIIHFSFSDSERTLRKRGMTASPDCVGYVLPSPRSSTISLIELWYGLSTWVVNNYFPPAISSRIIWIAHISLAYHTCRSILETAPFRRSFCFLLFKTLFGEMTSQLKEEEISEIGDQLHQSHASI